MSSGDDEERKIILLRHYTPYYPINVPKELNRPRPNGPYKTQRVVKQKMLRHLVRPSTTRADSLVKLQLRSFAGHNKWSKIKRKKAVNDAARNKVYTKLLNQIAHALRQVDGDQSNAKFVQALQNAKSQGVPKSNIENAIKRGMGESNAAAFEEVSYEGSGPSGSLFIIDCLTDNRNRTGPMIRKIFKDFDGNLGSSGQAQWAFNMAVGRINIDGIAEKHHLELEEIIFDVAMQNGNVVDILSDTSDANAMVNFCVLCDFSDLNSIAKGLDEAIVEKQDGSTMSVDYVHLPKDENMIEVEDDVKEALIEMINEFEDVDDVQQVAHNVNLE